MNETGPNYTFSRRSILLAITSTGLGALLIAALIVAARIDLHDTLLRIGELNWVVFLRLTVLMAFYTFLSSQKWRLVDSVLSRPGGSQLPRSTAFTLTSLGVALGQVLPVQVSVSIVRTLGTWMHGRAFRRGTLGTLFEQAFDFSMVCFLAMASTATRVLHGGPAMWLAFALPIALFAILMVYPLLTWLRRLTSRIASADGEPVRWRRLVGDLYRSGLLEVRLGRQLMAISAVRFAVLVLIAAQTTAAIHSHLPLWHLAAAMPFVVIANTIGITPGGLGVIEVTYSAMLTLYGTPLAAATQWAIANRLLSYATSLAVAMLASLLSLGIKGRECACRDRSARAARVGKD